MSQHSAVTRPSVSALSSYRAESEKDFIECRSRPIAARSNYHLPSLGERNEAKVKDESWRSSRTNCVARWHRCDSPLR